MACISKSFGRAIALAGVDLELHRDEVHALVGENGAGKSTLIKILTGAYQPDAGAIELDGKQVHFRSPADAQQAGVVAIYQEVNLPKYRSVAENIFLGREPKRFGLIDRQAMHRGAAEALESLGLNIDPRKPLGELSTALRQMVAITRGVCLGAKVLVFDEPTSSITEQETAILFRVIRDLQANGASIVYISHRMEELYAICQRVTVLRDGKLVMTGRMDDLSRVQLIRAMLGKERIRAASASVGVQASESAANPLLELNHVARGQRVRDATLRVISGQVVGLAGLLGSGRSETARLVCGADYREQGEIVLCGKPFSAGSPADALGAGLGFVSEDRKHEGIIPDLSVRENVTLAALPTLSRFGIVSKKRQREIVDRFIHRLGIRLNSPEQNIRELSGGNQQKVLLARALCCHPSVLLLDEPTRGVDIGAKDEIHALIRELAHEGLGVLMISSELEELVENCSRVVVMREGRSVAELTGADISEQTMIHTMAQESPAERSVTQDFSQDGTRIERG
jgi:ribose transport system ATP-binding protein